MRVVGKDLTKIMGKFKDNFNRVFGLISQIYIAIVFFQPCS